MRRGSPLASAVVAVMATALLSVACGTGPDQGPDATGSDVLPDVTLPVLGEDRTQEVRGLLEETFELDLPS